MSLVSMSRRELPLEINSDLSAEQHRPIVVDGGPLRERAEVLLRAAFEHRAAIGDHFHRLREVELIRRQQQRERGHTVGCGLHHVARAGQIDAARAS